MGEKTVDKNLRSHKWDILKYVLIFLVVLGHAADYYTGTSETMRSLFFFIYIFHMPVFIFVSGLFAKRTVNEKRFDKMLGYIIIYVVLKLYPFCYRTLMGETIRINFFAESGVPWFMLALFWFNLITIITRKVPKAAVFSVSIAAACIVGYFPEIGDFLALSRVFVYFPFFYLGYCLDRQKIEDFCEGKTKKIAASVILVLIAVFVFVQGDGIYWLRPLLTGRNPFSKLGEYEQFGCLIRLAYYLAVSLVGCCLIIVMPKKTHFGLCEKFGQRTLAVYGLHFGAFYFIYNIFDCKELFSQVFGNYSEWTVVPISIAVTLFFSLKFFNSALTFLMNIPSRLMMKIKE